MRPLPGDLLDSVIMRLVDFIRVFVVNGPLGFFATPVDRAVDAPPLVIYGDGRVMWSEQRRRDAAPSGYRQHRLDPQAVARFAAESAATAVVSEDVDFGTPAVTDLGSTSVVLEGPGPRHSASAYALDERFDELVDRAQRDYRRLLRGVIAAGYALIGDATGQPYVPDRIGVLRLPTGEWATAATVPWPGPRPDRFQNPSSTRSSTHCGELTGDIAATVYRAAMTNPGQRWLVDDLTVTLAVNPLAIDLGC